MSNTTPLAAQLRECWGRLDVDAPPEVILQASQLLAMAAHALDLRKEHADVAVEAFDDSIKVNALTQSRLETEIDRLRGILQMIAEMPASTHEIDAELCREALEAKP